MDRTGERTPVDGVRGGGGGLEDDKATLSTFNISSELAIARGWALALSCANASQNALCVKKLSLLENKVPQSHLYSLVPQVFK